ncbi:NAD(P)-binding protein [Rhizobium sp. P40RR-XXII]|uniref:flavin monoamine oxidase family protein n=1 Tax=unclassified Rhizobium TaxID=2613769 RepID=UPI0014570636|nr:MULTISPECIES: FAD-dependent oxidoreductase [unclassified Rhizobium]NLR87880.1 NAD(P)-binding protein [Rhizobium sp. P28RR-XV]NLS19615.1 NAD(P)-binding protein [Rhizobium sp. P40RR-XXII]
MCTAVAIVGGGLAGLYAAWRLQASGIDFQLLEARRRLGGRILSVGAGGEPSADGFDLGPSWFWPGMHPLMAEVISELGLRHFAQHSDGDVVVERMRQEAPQRFNAMRQEPQSMRLDGGTGAIVTALANALPPERLRTGIRVTRIVLGEEGVDLTLAAPDGSTEMLAATQVILALPPRLLIASIAFAPALAPETMMRWRNTTTWMAPHAKFFALYDRPFWREAGLSGTAQSGVGPLVEIHDATTASGSAALFGFVGIPADQRAEIGEERLAQACAAQLARLFGPQAAQPRATLFKDWAADPLTATVDDRHGGAHPSPNPGPWITGPWAKRISLGGSETSATNPGYLVGALDAARRAASETMTRLSSTKLKETVKC